MAQSSNSRRLGLALVVIGVAIVMGVLLWVRHTG